MLKELKTTIWLRKFNGTHVIAPDLESITLIESSGQIFLCDSNALFAKAHLQNVPAVSACAQHQRQAR